MWLNIAKKYIGLTEIVGTEDNPKIVKMYADVGFPDVKDDETAWCAAFVGSVLKEDGKPYLKSLSARSYLKYGKKLTEPQEGCIVVFWRVSPSSWQGHVGFVTKWDDTHLWVIGGNQSNKVSEAKFPRSQVLGYRYPNVAVAKKMVAKEVIKNSSKLSVLQGIRRLFTFAVTAIGSIFTLDTFNISTAMISQLRTTVSDNILPIAIGSIALMWFILKWVEYRQLKDHDEGRYIPSGVVEEKEVTDGSL